MRKFRSVRNSRPSRHPFPGAEKEISGVLRFKFKMRESDCYQEHETTPGNAQNSYESRVKYVCKRMLNVYEYESVKEEFVVVIKRPRLRSFPIFPEPQTKVKCMTVPRSGFICSIASGSRPDNS